MVLRLGEFLANSCSRFGNLHLGAAFGASALLQAGLVEARRQNPNSYHTVNKILTTTKIINIFGTCWAIGKTINTLKERHNISLFSEKYATRKPAAPDWAWGKIFLVNSAILTSTSLAALAIFFFTPRNRNVSMQEHLLRCATVLQIIATLPYVLSLQGAGILLGSGSALISSFSTTFVKQVIAQANHHHINDQVIYYGIGAPSNNDQVRAEVGRETNYTTHYTTNGRNLTLTIDREFIPLNGSIQLERGKVEYNGRDLSIKTHEYGLLAIGMFQLLATYKVCSGSPYALSYFGKGIALTSLLTLTGRMIRDIVSSESETDAFLTLSLPFMAAFLIFLYNRSEEPKNEKPLLLENSIGNKVSLRWGDIDMLAVKWTMVSQALMDLHRAPEEEGKELYYLALASIKALIIYKLSQVRWLYIKQTIKTPLANHSVKVHIGTSYTLSPRATNLFKESVREVTLSQVVLIPDRASLFPTDEVLKQFAQPLLNQGENLFADSNWGIDTFDIVRTQYVTFKDTLPQAGEVNLSNWLWRRSGTVSRKGYDLQFLEVFD
ncbi:hypothetical protein [Candidatus Neptunichlamydia sp. REUL1]|uniref:hypothetical protein n=1 Tax=Candidatus Neptunichlamydia sp. REUL1 TaxID=3064277 RepID=UPI00292F734F|nr:hypothetical protein [Candidatus Neptunochlamydia sp. REUL1]